MRVLGVSCVFMGVLSVPGVPLFVPVEPAAVAIVLFPAIEVVNPVLVHVGEFPVIEEMAAFPISAVEAEARRAKAVGSGVWSKWRKPSPITRRPSASNLIAPPPT